MKFELHLDPHRLPTTPPAPQGASERGPVRLRLDIRNAQGEPNAGGAIGMASPEGQSLAERPASTAAAWRAASRHDLHAPGASPPVVSGAVPVLRTVVTSAPLPPPPRAIPSAASGPSRWFEATLSRRRTLWVPRDVHLVGDFRAHTVHVEGLVDGRVVATGGPLIVATGACVTGSVDGRREVVIAGQVVASGARPAVTARGHLHLGGTAQVVGSVVHRGVSVYEGAVVVAQVSSQAEPGTTS